MKPKSTITFTPLSSEKDRIFSLFTEATKKLNGAKIRSGSKLGETQGFAVWMTREQFLGLGGTAEAWDTIPEPGDTTLSRDNEPAQEGD